MDHRNDGRRSGIVNSCQRNNRCTASTIMLRHRILIIGCYAVASEMGQKKMHLALELSNGHSLRFKRVHRQSLWEYRWSKGGEGEGRGFGWIGHKLIWSNIKNRLFYESVLSVSKKEYVWRRKPQTPPPIEPCVESSGIRVRHPKVLWEGGCVFR